MKHLFIDKTTQNNFIEAYKALRNVETMHHSFPKNIREILSTLFYYLKFEKYPDYFFIKSESDSTFRAGNLKSTFKINYQKASFAQEHIEINFTIDDNEKIAYKPSFMSLIQGKKILDLSQEVLKNAKNSEIFYGHFKSLLNNQATRDDIQFFVNHFWQDTFIVGFFLSMFDEQVVNQILDNAPNSILLPHVEEVFQHINPKPMYEKTYATFQEKNRHYDRVYSDSYASHLITYYPQNEIMNAFIEKYFLEKKLKNDSNFSEQIALKHIRKI